MWVHNFCPNIPGRFWLKNTGSLVKFHVAIAFTLHGGWDFRMIETEIRWISPITSLVGSNTVAQEKLEGRWSTVWRCELIEIHPQFSLRGLGLPTITGVLEAFLPRLSQIMSQSPYLQFTRTQCWVLHPCLRHRENLKAKGWPIRKGPLIEWYGPVKPNSWNAKIAKLTAGH